MLIIRFKRYLYSFFFTYEESCTCAGAANFGFVFAESESEESSLLDFAAAGFFWTAAGEGFGA